MQPEDIKKRLDWLPPWKKPRDYQLEAIKTVFEKDKGVIVSPTGSGKGNMIAYLSYLLSGKILIIVPREDLLFQQAERIYDIFPSLRDKIGIIGANRNSINDITITTWQSAISQNVKKKLLDENFEVLIVDEAHSASGEKLSQFIEEHSARKKIGFTATYMFSRYEKEKRAKRALGDRIFSIDIETLYKKGHLLRPSIILQNTESEVGVEEGITLWYRQKIERNEKYRYFLLNEIFKNPIYASLISGKSKYQIAQNPSSEDLDVLANFAKQIKKTDDLSFEQKIGIAKKAIESDKERRKKIIDGLREFLTTEDRAIVLTATNEFADFLTKQLGEYGLQAFRIKAGDKSVIKNMRHSESYIGVGTISLLSDGFDLPNLEKIAVCSPAYPPFTDMTKLIQIIGRTVRPYEGKKPSVLIFDDKTIGVVHSKKEKTIKAILTEFHPKIYRDLEHYLWKEKIDVIDKIASIKNVPKIDIQSILRIEEKRKENAMKIKNFNYAKKIGLEPVRLSQNIFYIANGDAIKVYEELEGGSAKEVANLKNALFVYGGFENEKAWAFVDEEGFSHLMLKNAKDEYYDATELAGVKAKSVYAKEDGWTYTPYYGGTPIEVKIQKPTKNEKKRIITFFNDNKTPLHRSWKYKTFDPREDDKNFIRTVLVRSGYTTVKFDSFEGGIVRRKNDEVDVTRGLDAIDAVSFNENFWGYKDKNGKWHLMREKDKSKEVDFSQADDKNNWEMVRINAEEVTPPSGANEIIAFKSGEYGYKIGDSYRFFDKNDREIMTIRDFKTDFTIKDRKDDKVEIVFFDHYGEKNIILDKEWLERNNKLEKTLFGFIEIAKDEAPENKRVVEEGSEEFHQTQNSYKQPTLF